MSSNINSIICDSSSSAHQTMKSERSVYEGESKISGGTISNHVIQLNTNSQQNSLIKSSEINPGDKINVKKEETSKKFFVKLLGYEPKFYNESNISKRINEIIEDYLRTIKVEISDRLKRTFSYKGRLINLNEAIKNLDVDHLGWITSDFSE